jgi:hypothetical protein
VRCVVFVIFDQQTVLINKTSFFLLTDNKQREEKIGIYVYTYIQQCDQLQINMQAIYNSCELLDLSDDILLIIMEKLKPIDVLHSLVGVNKRLNKVARNRISNSCISLLEISSTGCICSRNKSELDRFCSISLPEMHHNIKKMLLESSSMERILLSGDYPNLSVLCLFILEFKMFSNYLSGMYLRQSCIQKINYISFRFFLTINFAN